MRQGTTPTLTLTIANQDLTAAAAIVATIAQGKTLLNFEADRCALTYDENAGTTINIHLTQAETLEMAPGRLEVQVRWRNPDGEAYATETATVSASEVLYQEVI